MRRGAKFKAAACARGDTETTGAVLESSRIGKLASRYGISLSLRSSNLQSTIYKSKLLHTQPIGLEMNLKTTTSITLYQSHDVSGIDTHNWEWFSDPTRPRATSDGSAYRCWIWHKSLGWSRHGKIYHSNVRNRLQGRQIDAAFRRPWTPMGGLKKEALVVRKQSILPDTFYRIIVREKRTKCLQDSSSTLVPTSLQSDSGPGRMNRPRRKPLKKLSMRDITILTPPKRE